MEVKACATPGKAFSIPGLSGHSALLEVITREETPRGIFGYKRSAQ